MTDLRTALALQPDHILYRSQRALLGAGALGLAATIGGALVEPVQFFRSYLVAYLFFVGIALGSLGLVSLNHVTGGRWGVVIRRVCESAMRTLPVLLVLFLPLLFGLGHLYEWARPEDVAHDALLQQQAAVLERALLHRAGRNLLRRLADRNALSRALVAPAGRDRRPGPGATPAVPRPRRAAALQLDHDLRGGRLGDVARAALVSRPSTAS